MYSDKSETEYAGLQNNNKKQQHYIHLNATYLVSEQVMLTARAHSDDEFVYLVRYSKWKFVYSTKFQMFPSITYVYDGRRRMMMMTMVRRVHHICAIYSYCACPRFGPTHA